LLFGLPHAVTLCGWLLPGPVIVVPSGAPRLTAIWAAVWPLPYRFETSDLPPGVPWAAVQLALPVPAPPVVQCVHLLVVLLGFRPGLDSVPSLALIVLVTVVSCTAFGMLLGSIGLRAKDFFFAANLAYFLMLLFCGVNIPLGTLPGWMSAIGRCLPLTHGIAAAREVAAGASLGHVGGLVGTELGIAAAYALAGLTLFRVLERESRRTAVLDAY
jgi:hypothetical protein